MKTTIQALDTPALQDLAEKLKNYRKEITESITEAEEKVRDLHRLRDDAAREFGLVIQEIGRR
jgi:hypothetical protein